jgi:hypothetical protein
MSDNPQPKGVIITFDDKQISEEFYSLDAALRFCAEQGITTPVMPGDSDYEPDKEGTRFKEGYFIKNTYTAH